MFAPHYKPNTRRRARPPTPLDASFAPPCRPKAERVMGSTANAGEDLPDELLCNKPPQKPVFNPRDTATKLTYFTNWGRKRGRRHLVMAQCLRLRLDCRRAKARRRRVRYACDSWSGLFRPRHGARMGDVQQRPPLPWPSAAVGPGNSRRGRRRRRVVWSALLQEEVSVRIQARVQIQD